MGIYCTTTSMATMLIGTTFDSNTTALCAKLITHAENEINKYLSKRYNITSFNATSTAVPPLVTSIAETLTEGYFYQRNSRGSKEGLAHGKSLIDQGMLNLKALSSYELDLLDSNGVVITDMSQTAYRVLCSTSNYPTTFNEDDELNWKVDQTKLDDIDSERG